MPALIILTAFGLATAIIGKAKGSSFFIWFLIGFCVPFIGLLTVIFYRGEKDELERRCPRCGTIHKLYVQVCSTCGEDMYMPVPGEEVRDPTSGRVITVPPQDASQSQ